MLVVGGDLKMNQGSINDETGSSELISSAEIYDPATGSFEPTGGLATFAGANIGVPLPDGRVAVMQLIVPDPMGETQAETSPTRIEIYDPATGTFFLAGSTPRNPDHAFALRDGRILLVGSDLVPMNMVGSGEYWDLYQPWALAFDPATGETDDLPAPRAERSGATLLADGRVLFAGGLAYPPPDENGNGTGDSSR